MAALWPLSRVPGFGAGALLHIYDSETTTPQPVYSDAALSQILDQPIEANASGAWPAVYLNTTPGTYHQRATTSDGATVLFDDDLISVPQAADYVPPSAGDTDVTLLARTGDLKARYGTGTHSGWVRAAGRTIGSASSGATERANSDCEDLFLHLWDADPNLSVSGGRGANAAADWAANKTIALPDWRDRVIIGLGDMGNSDANRIADSLTDDDNITLGATAGASTITLSTTQIPSHTHTAAFAGDALAAHNHTYNGGTARHGTNGTPGLSFRASDGDTTDGTSPTMTVTSVSAGTPSGTVTVDNAGGGQSHANIQPGMFATIYIKL